jgi:predicted dehydrogenase
VEYFVDDTRGLLAEFVAALEGGRPVVSSGKDHLKTLGLTLACIESSRTGSRVHMDEFYRRHELIW